MASSAHGNRPGASSGIALLALRGTSTGSRTVTDRPGALRFQGRISTQAGRDRQYPEFLRLREKGLGERHFWATFPRMRGLPRVLTASLEWRCRWNIEKWYDSRAIVMGVCHGSAVQRRMHTWKPLSYLQTWSLPDGSADWCNTDPTSACILRSREGTIKDAHTSQKRLGSCLPFFPPDRTTARETSLQLVSLQVFLSGKYLLKKPSQFC